MSAGGFASRRPRSLGWVSGCALAVAVLSISTLACRDEPAFAVSLRTTMPLSPREPSGAAGGPPTYWVAFDLRLDPRSDVSLYAPIMTYLEERTGRRFKLRFLESYEDVAEALGDGRAQFAFVGGVTCLRATRRHGASCLLLGRSAERTPTYRSAIVTSVDSGITDVAQLRGRRFAFGSRLSTQGHVLARQLLASRRLTVEDLAGHVFAGSHMNVARAIIGGAYDAGAMQDTLALELARKGRLRIIALSSPAPSSAVCQARDVPADVVAAVREALLSMAPMDRDKGTFPSLDHTEMAGGFAPCPADAYRDLERLATEYGLLP